MKSLHGWLNLKWRSSPSLSESSFLNVNTLRDHSDDLLSLRNYWWYAQRVLPCHTKERTRHFLFSGHTRWTDSNMEMEQVWIENCVRLTNMHCIRPKPHFLTEHSSIMLPQSRLRNLHGDLSPSSEHSTFSVRRKHPKAIAAARLQEARDRPKKTVHFSATVKVFRSSYVEVRGRLSTLPKHLQERLQAHGPAWSQQQQSTDQVVSKVFRWRIILHG